MGMKPAGRLVCRGIVALLCSMPALFAGWLSIEAYRTAPHDTLIAFIVLCAVVTGAGVVAGLAVD